jgi:hypothetical protein
LDNPFSTRHTRPGAIPFLFPPGDSATQVIDRLRANHWWGEIIGPHGSGKSTLLCALIPEIHRAGRGTLLIELHDGQRRLGVDLGREVGRKLDSVVIVDGYEQLALVNRWRLKRFCRRQGQGLVVTSHRTAGLPLVFRTEATPRLAEEIVRRLLQGLPATVDAAELERIFLRHRGNLREVLFELYDWYEQREAR